MDIKQPETLEKAMREAELNASRYEETGHLDEQEQAIAKRQEEERKRSVKCRIDMIQTLKVVEARRIMYRILEICGPYQPSFDPMSARQTDYNEGRRSCGLEVLKMIESADSGAYLQIINEHASDFKAEEERKRKENTK
jgi:hypothetical protein